MVKTRDTMKLTKQQCILAIIFLLACGALLGDRLFLLPRSSQAEGPDDVSASRSAELMLEVTDMNEVQSRTSLITRRLETLWPDDHNETQKLRDPFMLPVSWPVAQAPKAAPTQKPSLESVFVSRHRLRAVFVDGHRSQVVIDDHVLAIGQTLEGFTLVKVDEESATFESDNTHFVMRLSHDR
jgi:hypothetical protein